MGDLAGRLRSRRHSEARRPDQLPAHVTVADIALELRTRERFMQNEWDHIAVVSDGSGKAAGLTLYVNGAPAETDIVQDTLTGPIANAAELRIGAKEPDAKAFAGGLDDLRFYDRALSLESRSRHTAIDYPVQAMLSGVGGKPSKAEEERLRDYYLRYVAPEYFRTLYGDSVTDRERAREARQTDPHHDGDERARE